MRGTGAERKTPLVVWSAKRDFAEILGASGSR